MGLTRNELQGMVVITSVLLVVISLLCLVGWLQATGYEQATRDNCRQYEIIPEKYIDKVPSGCVPQWFEANKQ